jgi:hypothetical protein
VCTDNNSILTHLSVHLSVFNKYISFIHIYVDPPTGTCLPKPKKIVITLNIEVLIEIVELND